MSLVFISYSHKNDEKVQEILDFLETELEMTEFKPWRDEERIEASERWHEEIGKAIKSSKLGLLVVSNEFLRSKYIREHELPKLKAEGIPITWILLESASIRDREFTEFQAAHDVSIPIWDTRPKSKRRKVIVEICNRIREVLQRGARDVPADSGSLRDGPNSPAKIHRTSFPKVSQHLVGRDDLLERLRAAWDSSTTNVVSLIASGGFGKSAVLDHWYGLMAAAGFRGARRVYVWSFYGQGTEQQASSNTFFEHALRWFDPDAHIPPTVEEQGLELAKLVRRERTLLILDGLEPFQERNIENADREQYPIRDKGLAALLTSLAAENQGLCVLTSRFAVSDLSAFVNSTAPQFDVPPLDDNFGADLLKALGVNGRDEQRKELAQRCRGHALTLDLMGRLLWNAYDGDIAPAAAFLRGDDSFSRNFLSGPAARVMESYVGWFDRGGSGPSVESQLLRLIGLFDRPADSDEIYALCHPPIPGLSEGLSGVREMQLRLAFARLRDAGLIQRAMTGGKNSNGSQSYTVDAHPLVRNYFAAKLREQSPTAWKEGHRRLFKHLKARGVEEPKNAEELAVLYSAVHHGCLAECYEEAFRQVYWPRIHRRDRGLAHKWLGSNAAEVQMIKEFFEHPWDRTISGISDETEACVLGIACSRLRADGDLQTALSLSSASFQKYFRGWVKSVAPREKPLLPDVQLSVQSRHRAELLALAGLLKQAEIIANVSQHYAEVANHDSTRVLGWTISGWIAHQLGNLPVALEYFATAESLFREIGQTNAHLYTLWGYRYAEALIDDGRWSEVRDRAQEASARAELDLKAPSQADPMFSLGLLDQPLALLMQVLADCAESEATGRPPADIGRYNLDLAMRRFKLASKREFEPLCALQAARWNRLSGNEATARNELTSALNVAREIGLKLTLADAFLEAAEIELKFQGSNEAIAPLEKARTIIRESGYARRNKQLCRLEEAVGG